MAELAEKFGPQWGLTLAAVGCLIWAARVLLNFVMTTYSNHLAHHTEALNLVVDKLIAVDTKVNNVASSLEEGGKAARREHEAMQGVLQTVGRGIERLLERE